jgi:TPR repeat protein
MAVKQGDPNAMYMLADVYDFGKGVGQSHKKAAELYALAANQGHARAQYNLGVFYANGKGVAQSDEKAIELWTLAANQGHASAQGKSFFYVHVYCTRITPFYVSSIVYESSLQSSSSPYLPNFASRPIRI